MAGKGIDARHETNASRARSPAKRPTRFVIPVVCQKCAWPVSCNDDHGQSWGIMIIFSDHSGE
jgi:hypothetical protein